MISLSFFFKCSENLGSLESQIISFKETNKLIVQVRRLRSKEL